MDKLSMDSMNMLVWDTKDKFVMDHIGMLLVDSMDSLWWTSWIS